MAMTVGMLTTPWLLTRFGYRRTYTGTMLLLLVGGIAGGMADNFTLVLLARVAEGIAAGAALLTACLILPRRLHAVLAGLALLVGTALVNLAPENPFLPNDTLLALRGNLLNFHGLTSLAASLWPFLAFLYLGLLGGRSGRDGTGPH